MNRYDEIYPLTIVMDRYNGTYSGAQFTAWNRYFDDVPPEIDGSDVPCMHFWSKADRSTIGFGSDPTAAYNDLLVKMQAVDALQRSGLMTDFQKHELQWMIENDYSLQDLARELTEYQYSDPEDSDRISTPVSDLFTEWEENVGFGYGNWEKVNENAHD